MTFSQDHVDRSPPPDVFATARDARTITSIIAVRPGPGARETFDRWGTELLRMRSEVLRGDDDGNVFRAAVNPRHPGWNIHLRDLSAVVVGRGGNATWLERGDSG